MGNQNQDFFSLFFPKEPVYQPTIRTYLPSFLLKVTEKTGIIFLMNWRFLKYYLKKKIEEEEKKEKEEYQLNIMMSSFKLGFEG